MKMGYVKGVALMEDCVGRTVLELVQPGPHCPFGNGPRC